MRLKILALILARKNSKRLPGKNLRKIGNKTLVEWSIDAVKNIKEIVHIFVSTDDKKILRIAKKKGAISPWLRPKYLSKDNTTSEEAAIIANALENPLKAPLMIKERYTDSKLSLGAALLRIATIRNYTEIIELLIKQRPEVINAMGKNKETALDFASRNHTKVANLLRKHGGKTKKELEAGN